MTTTTDLLRRAAVLLDVYAADGGGPADKKYDDTHEIISGLLALADELERSVRCYRLLYLTSSGEWSHQGRPWVDGGPPIALLMEVNHSDRWKIEYAYSAPEVTRDAERWEKLYRRALNEANGLTNYVEDRPELRMAERRLEAIQADARAMQEPKP